MGTQNTFQEQFDNAYITSSEICQRLAVSRTSLVHARHRGVLPDPIAVNGTNIYIWERNIAEPYIKTWEEKLTARRNPEHV